MGIRIRSFDKKKFISGWLLVSLGICMPYFLTINTLHIPSQAYSSIVTGDKMVLWMAAIKLAALNAIRAFPHSVGAFMVAESIEVDSSYKITKWLKSAIVCLIIPAVYFSISSIHHIKYDLGIPAFTIICLLILLGKRDYSYVSLWKKNLMIIVILTALQFLDIMPVLRNLPIGRGEMSRDIKLIAQFLGMESELDATAFTFFLFLMFMGVLLFLLIRDENNLKAMNELKEQNERLAMDTKLRVLENRTYLELSHLVHDLKSPLTSAQALVGVVQMSCETDGKKQESEYLKRVEVSIEKMSGMISEILYEDHTSRVSTGELFDSVLAQISVSEYSKLVTVENRIPEKYVQVNKIRFSRALVNLLENSFYAISSMDNGKIDFLADASEEEGKICFTIRDNGKGIAQKSLSHIWESGFSTRSSHGLGLSFVKKVVTDSEGSIKIQSSIGVGTTIQLIIPEEIEKGNENEYGTDQDTIN